MSVTDCYQEGYTVPERLATPRYPGFPAAPVPNGKKSSLALLRSTARLCNSTFLISQTGRFSRKRDDKSLCDSNIAQCLIPAKLVLDLIGERESSQSADYWIPAFAGMTRRTGLFELSDIRYSRRPHRAELPTVINHQARGPLKNNRGLSRNNRNRPRNNTNPVFEC